MAITREEIQPYVDYISTLDEQDGLSLFCYDKCSDESPEFVKKCRGIIFKGNELISTTFGYTPEFLSTDEEKLKNIDISNYNFFISYEGTFIRLFYTNDKWYCSTHRKINAFKSKWSSKNSFGSIFVSSVENATNSSYDSFLDSLNTENQYIFLLQNNLENRIVCETKEIPNVYHIGTYVNFKFTLDDNLSIPKPTSLTFETKEEILTFVNSINYKEQQGIIAINKNGENSFKILNSTYQEYFKTRGNEPNIEFRYLQIRRNISMVKKLVELYPDYEERFKEIENILSLIANHILQSYVRRFIKKEYVSVPKNMYSVIVECHNWHNENREKNKINFYKVKSLINFSKPLLLQRMILEYKNFLN
jgi:hypothetical protein